MSTPISVSDWLDMMASTVTIDKWTGYLENGTSTFAGAPVSFICYIEMKNHTIVNSQGREIMARGKVFLGTTTAPDVRDKLTLPAGYIPTNPPILAVNIADDENGAHHVTLEIG